MNTDQPLRRRFTAMHEAGHAAVALRLGHEIDVVTIVPTFFTEGHCALTSYPADPLNNLMFTMAGEVAVEMSMPGGAKRAAEVKRAGEPGAIKEMADFHASIGLDFDPAIHLPKVSDGERIEQAMAEMATDTTEIIRGLPRVQWQAMLDTVDHLKAVWPGVLRLADALMEYGTVDGERATELLTGP